MACTTILVGKNASYDGSTLVARNDDSPTGVFHAKKMVVVHPNEQVNPYISTISKVKVDLPKSPLKYTLMPNVDKSEGVWGASGINELNVSMSATETITSNPRVLSADPLVTYRKKTDTEEEKIGGIGEEDLVVLVLPYIKSAKEGVYRLAELLEKYGTYESNGIAFSDENDIWWVETIGGHHFIAARVPDDRYVVMPNQFGLDNFDFDDAFGEQKNYICSKDLKEFIKNNHLDLNNDPTKPFNPRIVFGSKDDSDHVYNTPRAWYMLRYFNFHAFDWDNDPLHSPLSDDLPWSMVPEQKITIEDVKYILSSYYQGTKYDPYAKKGEDKYRGMFRPIGISRTSFMSCAQIKGYESNERKSVEWVCFGSNAFNAFVPLFTNVDKIPEYFNNTTLKVDTNNFYWSSRLIGALADAHYQVCAIHIERFQDSVITNGHRLIKEATDNNLSSTKELEKQNELIAKATQAETDKALNNVLYVSSCNMKNGFARSDN